MKVYIIKLFQTFSKNIDKFHPTHDEKAQRISLPLLEFCQFSSGYTHYFRSSVLKGRMKRPHALLSHAKCAIISTYRPPTHNPTGFNPQKQQRTRTDSLHGRRENRVEIRQMSAEIQRSSRAEQEIRRQQRTLGDEESAKIVRKIHPAHAVLLSHPLIPKRRE